MIVLSALESVNFNGSKPGIKGHPEFISGSIRLKKQEIKNSQSKSRSGIFI
ncbi:hypothetical protein LY54_01460 [Salegentibacter mishustinae]|nr:hypothetical protein LY54_01460 [Salegentibacter mishustinae]GGW86897.1 hypothetical protein GCM10008086_14150 [Salegentibacter mishustinae]